MCHILVYLVFTPVGNPLPLSCDHFDHGSTLNDTKTYLESQYLVMILYRLLLQVDFRNNMECDCACADQTCNVIMYHLP